MRKELLIKMVRGNTLCDCPTLSSCATIRTSQAVIYEWSELVDLLESLPHFVVAELKVRSTK